MAFINLTQNFGVNNAGAKAYISTNTGTPATLLSSATGGFITDRGVITLDNTGAFNVYVTDQFTYTVALDDGTDVYPAYPAPLAGVIGGTPVNLVLAFVGWFNRAHNISVSPASGCTILIESSTDSGATWATVGTATASASFQYMLEPGENWVSNLRLTRTVGTLLTSTYSLGA
jgi:hypothetical protein